MLGRSLFEESLRLAQIEAAGNSRAELLIGWEQKSLNEKIGLYKVVKSLGLDPNWDDMVEGPTVYRRVLAEYQKRYHIKRARAFLQTKTAALKFGRAHDVGAYSLAHELVHGSDAAFLFNRRMVEAGAVSINVRTTDPKVGFAVANFCVRSLLQSARATAVIFGKNAAAIDALFNESTELEERFDREDKSSRAARR